MSILVTGGTGALGFHILSGVTRSGRKLFSFSDEQPQPWQKVPDVNYLTGNLLNFKDLFEVIQKIQPQYIYHFSVQPNTLKSHLIRPDFPKHYPFGKLNSYLERHAKSSEYPNSNENYLMI